MSGRAVVGPVQHNLGSSVHAPSALEDRGTSRPLPLAVHLVIAVDGVTKPVRQPTIATTEEGPNEEPLHGPFARLNVSVSRPMFDQPPGPSVAFASADVVVQGVPPGGLSLPSRRVVRRRRSVG